LEAAQVLTTILKVIRPLNIPDIQRLLFKNKKAADSIQDQDIVLVVGSTGSGKSTTLQMLAGGNMKLEKVEIEPGKFLDHIRVEQQREKAFDISK